MARHYLAEQRTVVRPSHSRRRDRDWAVLPLQLALFSTLHRSVGPHGPSEALYRKLCWKAASLAQPRPSNRFWSSSWRHNDPEAEAKFDTAVGAFMAQLPGQPAGLCD